MVEVMGGNYAVTPVLFLSESFRDGGTDNEKANFLDCDD